MQVRALRSHMGSISSQSQVLVQQLYHAKSELKRLQSLHLNQVEALRSDLEVARLNAVRSEAELVKLRPAVRSRKYLISATVTNACPKRAGAAASVERRRREPQSDSRAAEPVLFAHARTLFSYVK